LRIKAKPGTIPIVPLSDRELEVLKLIVDGKSNQEIANKIFVTLATVKTHVRSILNKLSVDDRTQAAVKAMRQGLVNF
jgi:DNA-binding NarL/FixJ family response regulator